MTDIADWIHEIATFAVPVTAIILSVKLLKDQRSPLLAVLPLVAAAAVLLVGKRALHLMAAAPTEIPPPVPGPDASTLLTWVGTFIGGLLTAAGTGWAVLQATTMLRRRRDRQAQRHDAVARHDAVREEVGSWESDVLAILESPLLADVSEAQTQRFIEVFEAARVARLSTGTRADLDVYLKAVADLETSWRAAMLPSRQQQTIATQAAATGAS
ncbi:hypothetical protein OG689_42375 [Kitasatospora sp. NBC_00240]|uniref:hypothetical protein n=1 Tax=Kitasatospora sp. NBC_00240 TaxID=2903567 RepID=UPI0022546873|nr:hypothetical protein [Kitasatospora sp. NBC_00240]MCX5215802.1 hypothetical protein [Kitasatospora sp. NBC_00240]